MVFTSCPPQSTSFIHVNYHLPRRSNHEWLVPTINFDVNLRKCDFMIVIMNIKSTAGFVTSSISEASQTLDSHWSNTRDTSWPIRVLESTFRRQGCSRSCSFKTRSFYFSKNGEFYKFYKFNFSLWSFICLDQLKRHSDIRLYIIFMITNIIISIESL